MCTMYIYLARSIIQRMSCKFINGFAWVIGLRNYLAIFRCFSTSAIVFTWDNVLCYIICARAVSVKPCSEDQRINQAFRPIKKAVCHSLKILLRLP